MGVVLPLPILTAFHMINCFCLFPPFPPFPLVSAISAVYPCPKNEYYFKSQLTLGEGRIELLECMCNAAKKHAASALVSFYVFSHFNPPFPLVSAISTFPPFILAHACSYVDCGNQATAALSVQPNVCDAV